MFIYIQFFRLWSLDDAAVKMAAHDCKDGMAFIIILGRFRTQQLYSYSIRYIIWIWVAL